MNNKTIETYYCSTCKKIHPKYLKGCLSDDERRVELARMIVSQTKSF